MWHTVSEGIIGWMVYFFDRNEGFVEKTIDNENQ
jgi:hypothetical protein